jgi:tetratricopeptide (TPR) repeat protein
VQSNVPILFSMAFLTLIGAGCVSTEESRSNGGYPQHHVYSPEEAHRLNTVGLELAGASEWQKAERSFREAIAADAYSAGAHNNLGLVLMEQGRVYEAALAFARAKELAPRALEPVLNLGSLYEMVGWQASAIEEYELANSLAPNNVEVQGRLAGLYLESGTGVHRAGPLLRALAAQTLDERWQSWACNRLPEEAGDDR